MEVCRLEAIEHNTLITHGFLSGNLIPVLDAESERPQSRNTSFMNLVIKDEGKKRKERSDDHLGKEDIVEPEITMKAASHRRRLHS